MADVTKRMAYFDRQFLRAADFQTDQAYDLDRRRRHNRLLHGPGVAEGLQVAANIGDTIVTVSAGTAYDALGQEIVLAASQNLDTSVIAGATATAFITIAYGEQPSDPSTDPGVTGNSTRISEQPALAASGSAAANPNLTLLLAKVALANGKVSAAPNNSVRAKAGALLSDDVTFHSLTFRNDAVAVSTWPSLTCSAANYAAVQNASIAMDASREVLFKNNGQVRSADDSHRIVFNQQNAQNTVLELREAGDIAFLTGGASPTEKMRVTAAGHVGVGTSAPDLNLTVQGSPGAFVNVRDTESGGPFEIRLGVDSTGGMVSTVSNHDLQLRSGNNIPHMIIKTDGKVGIGTTTPAFQLDVTDRIQLRQGPNGTAGIWLFQSVPNKDQAFIGMASDTQVGLWGNTGAAWGLVMDTGTGNVGIGIQALAPAAKLDVGGAVHGSSFPTSSDQRFKKNVAPLTDALAKVEQIRGVMFDWNEIYESLGRSTGRREVGVIAQDVEKACPELVSNWGEDGYKAVDYGRMAALLVEAIKELAAKNRSLEQRVTALEGDAGAAQAHPPAHETSGQRGKSGRAGKPNDPSG